MSTHTHALMHRGTTSMQFKAVQGDYIRELREAKGMTQVELANAVGLRWATHISAIENGRSAVSPERYVEFAEALGVDLREFGKKMLEFNAPYTYALLFAPDPKKAIQALNELIPPRVGKRTKA